MWGCVSTQTCRQETSSNGEFRIRHRHVQGQMRERENSNINSNVKSSTWMFSMSEPKLVPSQCLFTCRNGREWDISVCLSNTNKFINNIKLSYVYSIKLGAERTRTNRLECVLCSVLIAHIPFCESCHQKRIVNRRKIVRISERINSPTSVSHWRLWV